MGAQKFDERLLRGGTERVIAQVQRVQVGKLCQRAQKRFERLWNLAGKPPREDVVKVCGLESDLTQAAFFSTYLEAFELDELSSQRVRSLDADRVAAQTYRAECAALAVELLANRTHILLCVVLVSGPLDREFAPLHSVWIFCPRRATPVEGVKGEEERRRGEGRPREKLRLIASKSSRPA